MRIELSSIKKIAQNSFSQWPNARQMSNERKDRIVLFSGIMAIIGLAVAFYGSTVHSQTASPAANPIVPVADKITCAVADLQDFQTPDRVHLNGMLGTRIQVNAIDRLLIAVDNNRLLQGYTKRPGEQTWQGEHIGKWLHAATLAWVYTGDERLRAKLGTVVAELMKCQLDDGYLGTYELKNRWTEWDLWSHKYNLIGLITYMRYTGDMSPLPTCRKMADLLCKEFGDKPGQRDIMRGEHVGMAPASVLEPMVWLYRLTGDDRYRDFCKYILKAFEHPNGPKIVSRLMTEKRVDRVANGKAHEMLSCLIGLLEWYRTTGDRQYLDASLNAWEDIVAKRLYITGGSSVAENFHGEYDFPNVGRICETCVTVSWIEFNANLLRLTGEARFAEQLEHVVYNQLLGSQRPDGKAWGYYVEMEGKKPYSDSFFGHCCLSSGPRGISLIPTFAITTDKDGVVANCYDAGDADLRLRDGKAVKLHVETIYPSDGKIAISVNPASASEFTLKLRIPAWCKNATASVNGSAMEMKTGKDGYLAIKRMWNPSDKVELTLQPETRVIVGDHMNKGKIAVICGPLVLAADEKLLETSGIKLDKLVVTKPATPAAAITPEPAPENFKSWPNALVYVFKSAAAANGDGKTLGNSTAIRLVPFSDAGMTGASYKVWLPVKKPAKKG